MKYLRLFLLTLASALIFSSCAEKISEDPISVPVDTSEETAIVLSDEEIKINGINKNSVKIDNNIIYYEEGKDFTYGEGEKNDAHSEEEADAHKVVTITRAGTYTISGKLSKGQIAVDLGEDAENDPDAVVTLVLDGVDITSTVAPAVIFYNVYECGSKDEEGATKDVDTSTAGARVIIAKDSTNNINGSYVARIYKPDSVTLSEDGSEVLDAKKLHKYDAAFYSKQSMVLDGEGTLNITAENEGLDSELHLTINGGSINIKSGNDGINTNEDNISVTTVNGGVLTIEVTGETGEGDGIDSNGWLVINGGTVIASACAKSADAGIDADKGIHINGGTVIAGGNMLDRIEEGGQTYAVFNLAGKQKGNITLKRGDEIIISEDIKNDCSVLILSSPDMTEDDYTLWSGEIQLQGSKTENMMGGMMKPDGMSRPEGFEPPKDFDPEKIPEGMEPPKDFDPEKFNGQIEDIPHNFEKGEFAPPDRIPPEKDYEMLEKPFGDRKNENLTLVETLSTIFRIEKGANHFRGVTILEAIAE